MKSLTPLTLFLIILCLSGFSQEKSFTFKGQVHAYGVTLKGASIEVYDAGDLVHESITKGTGKFEFELKAEREYIVEIFKEDFRMKSIWINTKRTQQLKNKIPSFAFDVVLKKEKITRYDELSEIPVTLIKYNVKKKAFHMDKTYIQALKNQKQKIKNRTIDLR